MFSAKSQLMFNKLINKDTSLLEFNTILSDSSNHSALLELFLDYNIINKLKSFKGALDLITNSAPATQIILENQHAVQILKNTPQLLDYFNKDLFFLKFLYAEASLDFSAITNKETFFAQTNSVSSVSKTCKEHMKSLLNNAEVLSYINNNKQLFHYIINNYETLNYFKDSLVYTEVPNSNKNSSINSLYKFDDIIYFSTNGSVSHINIYYIKGDNTLPYTVLPSVDPNCSGPVTSGGSIFVPGNNGVLYRFTKGTALNSSRIIKYTSSPFTNISNGSATFVSTAVSVSNCIIEKDTGFVHLVYSGMYSKILTLETSTAPASGPIALTEFILKNNLILGIGSGVHIATNTTTATNPTFLTLPIPGVGSPRALAYTDNSYYVFGSNTATYAFSKNMFEWEVNTLPFSYATDDFIINTPNFIIAVDMSDRAFYVCHDGATWVRLKSPVVTPRIGPYGTSNTVLERSDGRMDIFFSDTTGSLYFITI